MRKDGVWIAVKQKQKPYFESYLSHIETFQSLGTAAVSKPVASPHPVDVLDAVVIIPCGGLTACVYQTPGKRR